MTRSVAGAPPRAEAAGGGGAESTFEERLPVGLVMPPPEDAIPPKLAVRNDSELPSVSNLKLTPSASTVRVFLLLIKSISWYMILSLSPVLTTYTSCP